MEIMVAAGLLIAVLVRVALVCHRLHGLRKALCDAWTEWEQAARRRNEALREVTEELAPHLPTGDMLPRTLRRLLADSDCLLQQGAAQLWLPRADLRETERRLRAEAGIALHRAESEAHGAGSVFSARLREAQRLRREAEAYLRTAAEAYNTATEEPPLRLLAASFGFAPCALPCPLDSADDTRPAQEAPAQSPL